MAKEFILHEKGGSEPIAICKQPRGEESAVQFIAVGKEFRVVLFLKELKQMIEEFESDDKKS